MTGDDRESKRSRIAGTALWCWGRVFPGHRRLRVFSLIWRVISLSFSSCSSLIGRRLLKKGHLTRTCCLRSLRRRHFGGRVWCREDAPPATGPFSMMVETPGTVAWMYHARSFLPHAHQRVGASVLQLTAICFRRSTGPVHILGVVVPLNAFRALGLKVSRSPAKGVFS